MSSLCQILPFTWEPAQETHRKEVQLIKHSGLKSSPIWAFKCQCIDLVNLHTERGRKKNPCLSQPAKKNWVIPGNQWDDTSLRRMAFLDEKVILHIGPELDPQHCYSFGHFVWVHQKLPHTRCHQPCPNLNPSGQRTSWSSTWERKTKSSPILPSQRNENFCSVLKLGYFLLSSLGIIPLVFLSSIFILAFLPRALLRQRHIWVSLSKTSLPPKKHQKSLKEVPCSTLHPGFLPGSRSHLSVRLPQNYLFELQFSPM